MDEERKIKLKVSLEEAKLIFSGLAKLPFEQVFELIGDLNKQVNEQLKEKSGTNNGTPSYD